MRALSFSGQDPLVKFVRNKAQIDGVCKNPKSNINELVALVMYPTITTERGGLSFARF